MTSSCPPFGREMMLGTNGDPMTNLLMSCGFLCMNPRDCQDYTLHRHREPASARSSSRLRPTHTLHQCRTNIVLGRIPSLMQDEPTTVGILLDLVKNGARMGPIVNARMTAAAFFGMPYGIAFAGAQGCIQAVQSGNSEGAATLTADLVDLGYVRAITWIVLNLVDRDRSDIVVEVSVAMMAKKYVSQMTLITKEILEQGRADAGASISGEMLKNGNLDFVKIWNEARKADEGEDEKDSKSVKEQVKDAVGSVVGNAKDSDREAAKAEEEADKSLQEKAKEAASRMSSQVQEAFDNTKVKGQA